MRTPDTTLAYAYRTIKSRGNRLMIPETENPREAKSVYPGNPARHARLIRVDSLRNVHNVDFLARRLKYNGGLFTYPCISCRSDTRCLHSSIC